MSIIDKLACSMGIRHEIPNQELAEELCRTKDESGIRELVQCLFEGGTAIKNDGIKVLYEIGDRQPELIASYANEFIQLLNGKNNRLVWGAMTALATMADLNPDKIFANIDLIFDVIKKGSVITVDNGISVLAKAGSVKKDYEARIMPFILDHLTTCRPKEVAQHAERSMAIVNSENKSSFVAVLEKRWDALTAAQQMRVRKVIKKANDL